MSNQAEKIHQAATVAGSEAPTTLLQQMQQRWGLLVIGAVVVVAAIGGFVWYRSVQEQNNELANTALSRIRSAFEQGDYEKALTAKGIPPVGDEPVLGLESIVDQYGSTEAGRSASLMAANCYLNLGKVAEAKDLFEKAQKSESPVVQMGALMGLGACKEQDKDYLGAAELYEQGAKVGAKSGLDERCTLFAGIAYAKAGDKEKAAKSFTDIVKRNEGSEQAFFARAYLARLGMAID